MAKAHGSQCGFCTPGIVMSMYTLLRNNPEPTMEEIEDAFDGNLCRCTGYRPILSGFRTFAKDGGCCGGVAAGSDGCCMKGGASIAAEGCCKTEKKGALNEEGLFLLSETVSAFAPCVETPAFLHFFNITPVDWHRHDASQEVIFPPELLLKASLHRSKFYRVSMFLHSRRLHMAPSTSKARVWHGTARTRSPNFCHSRFSLKQFE
jgi:hypothetical protein